MRLLRHGLVWVCLLLFPVSGSLHGQALDSRPSAPGSLRATVYSSTSGALTWQRSTDDVGVRGYEVARDGEILVVADRLSYIDEDLQAGKGYNYSIVAIDTVGNRSTRAIARIETPDATPMAPSGLVARRHSTSEVSLGWDRAAAFGEQYDVKRDGVAVARTDGVSYFDDTLVVGRRYLFEVIAVNRQGQRSGASRLFVDAAADDGTAPSAGSDAVGVPAAIAISELPGTDEPTVDSVSDSADMASASTATPGQAVPAAPTGLRSTVYSPTAAGIAWARADVHGIRYEVRRDGVVVALTDATSHVTDELSPNTRYRFAIVAIDSQDARSPAAVTDVQTTGGAVARSVLSRLGHAVAREKTNALVSNVFLDAYLVVDSAVANLPPAADGLATRSTCADGGSVVITDNASPRSQIRSYLFERCVLMNRTLDGKLERETGIMRADATTSRSLRLSFDELTVRQGTVQSLTLVGSSVRVATETHVPACADRSNILFNAVNEFASVLWYTSEGTARVSAANYTERVSDAYPEQSTDVDCRQIRSLSFGGTARVSASWFGEGDAALAKRGQIVRDSRPDGLAGASASLSGAFADGSSFVMTVLSDADGTVQMDTVNNRDTMSFNDDYRVEPTVPFIAP